MRGQGGPSEKRQSERAKQQALFRSSERGRWGEETPTGAIVLWRSFSDDLRKGSEPHFQTGQVVDGEDIPDVHGFA